MFFFNTNRLQFLPTPYIYIYKELRLCNNCMLRPLRKANAETRRVFNKALKTEAHSPLCKLYIYIYIYIYIYPFSF